MRFNPWLIMPFALFLASCTKTVTETRVLEIPESLLSVPERPVRPEYPSTAWDWHPVYTSSLEAYADDLYITLEELVWWLTDGNQSLINE